MPVCRGCGEEADELVFVKVDGKRKKLCEQCAELASENDAVLEESESVVRRMMEFKGKR